jgi:hypothetical protein
MFAIVAVAVFVAGADAQPSHILTWSLEARIAAAEAVVIGPIVKVNRKVLIAPGKRAKGGSAVFPDGQHEQAPEVAIEEVIKGNLKGIVSDLHPRWSTSPDLTYDQWMKAGNKLLWFLGPVTSGKTRNWHMVALGQKVPHEAFYGGRREPPMLRMDFTVLRTEADVLASARQYAKTSKNVAPTDTIRYGPPWHDLMVPVEPALEPLVTQLILTPRKFVPAGEALSSRDRYQLRYSGVRLLRHFKSETNIDLLRHLLDDPLENFQLDLIRQHPVRVKAFEVLLHWNVKSRPPKDPHEVHTVDLSNSSVADESLKQLTELKNLAHLDLTDTKVTADGLKNLAGLSKLRLIDLEEHQRSDAVLRALRDIGLLHALSAATAKGDERRPRAVEDVSALYLCRGPLTDEGLKEITVCRNLEYLELRDTRITDAGLKELFGLKKLETLLLAGTKVTSAGVAELKKALPGCKIQR